MRFEIRDEGKSNSFTYDVPKNSYIMNRDLSGYPKTVTKQHGISPAYTKLILRSPLVVERIKACIKEE